MATPNVVLRPVHSSSSDLQPHPSPELSELTLRPPTALMFIGNARVGKSMLLNQLGGNFRSGIGIHGVTASISETLVDLKGKNLILVDVPGLSDRRQETKERNVDLFVQTLRNGYHYKLVFVLKSCLNIITDEDLGLLSEVHRCLREANSRVGADGVDWLGRSRVSFHIIVNCIPAGQELYRLYRWHAEDRFQTIFRELELGSGGIPFDIPVSGVLLLEYDENAVNTQGFRKDLIDFIEAQRAVPVSVVAKIDVSDDLMTRIGKALAFSNGILVGGTIVGAACCLGYLIAKTPLGKSRIFLPKKA